VGDAGYQFLLKLNRPVNFIRRIFGHGYWSLSSYVKMGVKNAVNFIGQFEEAIVRYSKEYSVQGVVCGHIHAPVIRKIQDVDYFNTGDWVESCSVLLEDFEGKISLLTNVHPSLAAGDPPLEEPDDQDEPPITPNGADAPEKSGLRKTDPATDARFPAGGDANPRA
jgi:hypothetical protein